MESNKLSLKKNYFYNLVYQILSTLTPLLTAPYISRTLGVDKIGVFSFCSSFALYFMIIISFGFNMYLQTITAKHRDNIYQQSVDFFGVLICKTILTIFSTSIYILISFIYFKNYLLYLFIFLINLFSTFFDMSGYIAGNYEYKFLALRGSIFKIIYILLILLLVKNPSDLWIYCLIFVLTNLFSNIFVFSKVKKYLVRVNISDIKINKHFFGALTFFVPTFAVTLFLTIDKTMIGLLVDGVVQNNADGIIYKLSEIENGYFEEADKIIRILLSLLTSLNTIMLSRSSYLVEVGKKEKVKKELNFTIVIFLMFSIPMMFGIISISFNFVNWFFGMDFYKAGFILAIMAPLLVSTSINNCIFNQYIFPNFKQRQSSFTIIICCAFSTIISIPLIKKYNAIGASIALLVYDYLLLMINAILSRKVLEVKSLILKFLKYLICGIMMFVPICWINYYLKKTIYMFASVIIGVIIYFLILIIVRDRDFIYMIKKLSRKKEKSKSVE